MATITASEMNTSRNGYVYLFDGSKIRVTADTSGVKGDIEGWDGSSLTDLTASAIADASAMGTVFATASDSVIVGAIEAFGRIEVGVSVAATATGTLVAKYWNGSSWATLTTSNSSIVDGSASGGNCFATAGYITFVPPRDWSNVSPTIGSTALDDDTYYIQLQPTHNEAAADPDVICPVLPYYVRMGWTDNFRGYSNMSTIAQKRFVADRGDVTRDMGVIPGDDTDQIQVRQVSFDIRLDSIGQNFEIIKALQGNNPSLTGDNQNWQAAGTATHNLANLVMAQVRGNDIIASGLFDSNEFTVGIAYFSDAPSANKAFIYPLCVVQPAEFSESADAVTYSITADSYCFPIEAFHPLVINKI